MRDEITTNNPLIKIALGLLVLAGAEFKTVSIVGNSIIAGDAGCMNIRETLEGYGWRYDMLMDTWRFDMSQLEENNES